MKFFVLEIKRSVYIYIIYRVFFFLVVGVGVSYVCRRILVSIFGDFGVLGRKLRDVG